jgi:hypothetical protein
VVVEGTWVNSIKLKCHSSENTLTLCPYGSYQTVGTQKGRAFDKCSEIELSSLAIFNPPCFIFLAAAWERREGEKRMAERAW